MAHGADTLTPNRFSVDNLKRAAVLILEWLGIYFSPAITMIGLVGVMVTLDLITGILASRKEGTYQGSKGLRRSIPKFVVYGAGVITANLIQNLYFPDFPVVKLVGGFIIWVEVKSINENIERTTGLNIMQSILRKLQGFIK